MDNQGMVTVEHMECQLEKIRAGAAEQWLSQERIILELRTQDASWAIAALNHLAKTHDINDSCGCQYAQSVINSHKELQDANRYRYLREEDNWGDDNDSCLDSWEVLGESHGSEFDTIVDARMKAMELDNG